MVQYVAGYWKDTLVKDIKTPAIHAGAWKLFPHTGAASRNRRFIVPTQCIINYSAKQGLCAPLRVEYFKERRKEKEPVTLDWVVKFCQHADPEMALLALLMYCTGARINEALTLRWSDIDGNQVSLRVSNKGNEALYRAAHMPAVLVQAFSQVSRKDDYVFSYAYPNQAKHHWNRVIKRAGIKLLTFHSCRHGFATGLLHKGIDPVTVAKLGGWASPQYVFSTYGHAMRDKTVVERLVDTELTQPLLTQGEKHKEIEHLDADE